MEESKSEKPAIPFNNLHLVSALNHKQAVDGVKEKEHKEIVYEPPLSHKHGRFAPEVKVRCPECSRSKVWRNFRNKRNDKPLKCTACFNKKLRNDRKSGSYIPGEQNMQLTREEQDAVYSLLNL